MYRISDEVTGEDVAVVEVEFSTDIISKIPIVWESELIKAYYQGRIEQWSFYDGAPNKLRIQGYVVEWV